MQIESFPRCGKYVFHTTTGEAPPDGGASLHLESRVSPL